MHTVRAEVLHISAALGAWQRAGCAWEPAAPLCSLCRCCSERTLLTRAVTAVPKPPSKVEANTGFVCFSSKQALRDSPLALFQTAAISLALRDRVSGLKQAILQFAYSTVFRAERNALHQCLLPFVIQLRSLMQSKTLHTARYVEGVASSCPLKLLPLEADL